MTEYIIPPGLKDCVEEFEAHFKVANHAPIIIFGPSGVGKSLFLHIHKNLCHKAKNEKCRIITANCSHFSGDLARSELFGHAKGAFTGAVREKEGWLKRADNGILVLEEIGELPKGTQANLLTFIETGEFHKVGSTRIENAKVKIVGATNNEQGLREDFCYRFFPFYIPPLYERRKDVLYYLANKFPQLIASLAPWEAMLLLAYNWPGNVREIERVGLLLMRKNLILKKNPSIEPQIDLLEEAIHILKLEIPALSFGAFSANNAELKNSGLGSIGYKATALKGYQAYQLYHALKSLGVDVNRLETLLNQFYLGLSVYENKYLFEKFRNYDFNSDQAFDERLDVAFCREIEAFSSAYLGIQAFCSLFWVNEKENANLLDFSQTALDVPYIPLRRYFDMTSANIALFNSIQAYIKKIRKDDLDLSQAPDIYGLSREELMSLYYTGLLERTGDNKAKAAKIAGMNYSTFRSDLVKHGIVNVAK
jgi:DNA-binding NtrC family response regulator